MAPIRSDNAVRDHVDLPAMTPEVAAALTPTLVGATAIAALLLVVLAYESVEAVDIIVHEGGHMVVGSLVGRRVRHFEIESDLNAYTRFDPAPWGPARIISAVAGYPAVSLVGLGGAALLAAGLAWPLLWTAVVLLVLAWIKSFGDLTSFVVVVLAVAIGYVAIYGSPVLQAAIAAGLVWLLLFSGLRSAATIPMNSDGSDAAALARDTLIPRQVWKAGFIAFAVYCLWKGFLILKP
jgi:Peptidase M50B-like